MPSTKRPELRPVETLVVPDQAHGRVLVLRDTQGIAKGHAVLPPQLVPIVARFDGAHTVEQIAREASRELGQEVPLEAVERLVDELDRALFLKGDRFEAARAGIERAFADAPVREASHAGGAYHDDPAKLRAYLGGDCIAAARAEKTATRAPARGVRGLVAPHIDPWRGALGYGRSYGALADAIGDEVDTFLVFGTSHAPMREPFSICPKAFATPLGDVPHDDDACRVLAQAARFDAHADLFNHKREHSIEFQVLFLKHVLGARPFRVVPILAGLGKQQAHAEDPTKDAAVAAFIDAARELVAKKNGRMVVVAGADFAHVGPRFGDRAAYDEAARTALATRDRGSVDAAVARRGDAFWAHVIEDLEQRRVCGLAPIWSLLEVLPDASRGDVVHYEQTIDAEDGSIVSHAGIVFR